MDKIIVILTAGLMLIGTIIGAIVLSPLLIPMLIVDKIMNRIRLAWEREEDKTLRQKIGIGLDQFERDEVSECGDQLLDIKAKGRKRLSRKGKII